VQGAVVGKLADFELGTLTQHAVKDRRRKAGVESVLRVGRLSLEKRYGGKLRLPSAVRGWVCGWSKK